MTPVAAFAAVVAMAGPQRLAAESSMNEASHDLATFAVALSDGLGGGYGEVAKVLLPDCDPIAITASSTVGEREQAEGLAEVCALLLGGASSGADSAYLRRDLGNLGIDTGSWEGFYSESATVGCRISNNLESRDAVYVALAADWEDAGWAAAQAWPEGVRMGSEAVSRLNREASGSVLLPCELSPPPGSEPARIVFSK